MKLRKLFAWLMTLVMLLGIVPAGHAEGGNITPGGNITVSCNHNWDWRFPNGEPTHCQEERLMEMYCTLCGQVASSYPVTGDHTPGSWQWDGNPPANCYEWGIQNQSCSVCGEVFNEREVQGEHQWSGYVTETPAGCEAPGEEVSYCTVCGERGNAREIPPAGHDWGEWRVEFEATCNQEGLRVRYCKRCNMREEDYVQGDHLYGDWKVDEQPTCTERGLKYKACAYCGNKEWAYIPMIDHVMGDWRVIEEPQVGIPGTERRACIYGCGTHEDREIPPLEEDFDNVVVNPGDVYLDPDGNVNIYQPDNSENADGEGNINNGQPGDDEYVVITPSNPGNAGGLELTLVLTSTPANGSYFVVGEEVVFTETWVNNTGKELYPFYVSIWTYPTPEYSGVPDIMCSWDAEETGPVAPGQSGSHQLITTVTEADVARGAIYAMAIIISTENNGKDLADVITPFVTAPCAPTAAENSTGVRLEKELRNAPANGEYYVPGEVLNYALTLRIDDGVLLDDPAIYDPINGGDGLVISYGKGLYGSMGMDVFYTVTEEDAQRGYVENTAYATWLYSDSGEAGYCESETVTAICGIGELPGDNDASAVLKIETVPITVPSNGTHYVAGEAVILVDRFANLSDTLTLTGDSWVNVEIRGLGIFSPAGTFEGDAVLGPGEMKGLLTSEYVITAEDVAQGYIQKTIHAGFADENDNFYTGKYEIRIPCGEGSLTEDDAADTEPISVVKSILNPPANGEPFLMGQVIEFAITVTNNMDQEVADVILTDPLDSEWVMETGVIAPGASVTETLLYTVTSFDALVGYVENYVSGRAYVADGYRFLTSNVVTAPCRYAQFVNVEIAEDPFGVLTGLEIVLAEESLPMNGSCYTEGETFAYQLTYTNVGELPLIDVVIMDLLSTSDEVAHAEMLNPGDSRVLHLTYTVTADDVALGCIIDQAMGTYSVGDVAGSAISNILNCPASADDSPVPEDGTIPGGTIDTDKLHGQSAHCVRSSSSRLDVSYAWGTSFCIHHEGVQGTILTMEKAATTPEMQLQTANYAVALWRTEVDKLYQELLDAADPMARATIMTEYVTFLTHVANYEALLNALLPDQPALAAQMIADMWEEKCITLCMEMHTPAEQRQDSLLAVELVTGGFAESCSCVTTYEDMGWNGKDMSFCAAHSFPFGMIDMLLAGQDTAEAWATVRQIWMVEMRTSYNKLTVALGENSDLALAEYATLENWMIAREAELTLLYPDNPELVAQTMVRTVIDHVNALCPVTK